MNKLVTSTNVVFNVEKVKLNKLPRRFELEGDHLKTKMMSIDGKKVKVMIRPTETQYVAFQLTEQHNGQPFVQSYYVRDHKFFDNESVKTYVKPQPAATSAATPTDAAVGEAAKK